MFEIQLKQTIKNNVIGAPHHFCHISAVILTLLISPLVCLLTFVTCSTKSQHFRDHEFKQVKNAKEITYSLDPPGPIPDPSRTSPRPIPEAFEKGTFSLHDFLTTFIFLARLCPGPSRNLSQTLQDPPGPSRNPPRHPRIMVRRMCFVFWIESFGSQPTLQSSERHSSSQ